MLPNKVARLGSRLRGRKGDGHAYWYTLQPKEVSLVYPLIGESDSVN
jgi:hypothetical protein